MTKMKKVKRIIFEFKDNECAIWTPEGFEDKCAATYICNALHTADKNGGVEALVMGIRSKKGADSIAHSIGLIGTPKHIMSLIDRALEKLDAALESSSGKEEEE